MIQIFLPSLDGADRNAAHAIDGLPNGHRSSPLPHLSHFFSKTYFNRRRLMTIKGACNANQQLIDGVSAWRLLYLALPGLDTTWSMLTGRDGIVREAPRLRQPGVSHPL
jgi:hypothetical protein